MYQFHVIMNFSSNVQFCQIYTVEMCIYIQKKMQDLIVQPQYFYKYMTRD